MLLFKLVFQFAESGVFELRLMTQNLCICVVWLMVCENWVRSNQYIWFPEDLYVLIDFSISWVHVIRRGFWLEEIFLINILGKHRICLLSFLLFWRDRINSRVWHRIFIELLHFLQRDPVVFWVLSFGDMDISIVYLRSHLVDSRLIWVKRPLLLLLRIHH